jgi:hypothetical protein
VARAPPARETADITTNVGTDAFVRPAKRSEAIENKNKNQKKIATGKSFNGQILNVPIDLNAKTRWR